MPFPKKSAKKKVVGAAAAKAGPQRVKKPGKPQMPMLGEKTQMHNPTKRVKKGPPDEMQAANYNKRKVKKNAKRIRSIGRS
jgi:hypothetical protein